MAALSRGLRKIALQHKRPQLTFLTLPAKLLSMVRTTNRRRLEASRTDELPQACSTLISARAISHQPEAAARKNKAAVYATNK